MAPLSLSKSKTLSKTSKRNRKRIGKFKPTRPSSYSLSTYVFESFLANPPPGLKSTKKITREIIKYKPEILRDAMKIVNHGKITKSNYLDDNEVD
jgi:hypothetical protein